VAKTATLKYLNLSRTAFSCISIIMKLRWFIIYAAVRKIFLTGSVAELCSHFPPYFCASTKNTEHPPITP
jgi:hypothetical protein